MQFNWTTVLIAQALIWLIVLFEWKQLKKSSKADKITFSSILVLVGVMSCLYLEDIPGPISLLNYLFGPLGRLMG